MSELSIIIPPPRREPEVTLTIAFAIAVAAHAFPLIAADPEEPALEVDYDTGPCFPHGPEEAPPDDDDYGPLEGAMVLDRPQPASLVREIAIEQARISIRDIPARSWTDPTTSSFGDDEVSRLRPESVPVAIGTVYSSGGVDRRTVQRYLKRNLAELARCDDTAPSLRLDEPVADSAFSATFLIDRDGRVVQVVADDTRPVTACVTDALRAIVFPRPGDRELTQVFVALRYGTTDASAGVLVR